jgi:hypothetical protein
MTGPCSASPVHNSLGREASNRPKTCCCPGSAGGWFSSSRVNSRCSVRSDGAQPEVPRKIRCTWTAVRSGFSRFSAAASASTSPGVRGLACRGEGTSASNPPDR